MTVARNLHGLSVWNVNPHGLLSFRMGGRGPNPFHPPEREMSKRKTASKHARSPKIAAKAQRAAQAIVKSPKVARRSVSEGSAELARKPHSDAKPVAPLALGSFRGCHGRKCHSHDDRQQLEQTDLICLRPPQTCVLIKQS